MRGASAASVARANSSETAAEVRGAFRLSDKLDVETACLSAGLSCAFQPKMRKNGECSSSPECSCVFGFLGFGCRPEQDGVVNVPFEEFGHARSCIG